MMRFYYLKTVIILLSFMNLNSLNATKLVSVQPVDNQCIVLHFQDGYVEYNWDDTVGTCNGWNAFNTENWWLCPDKDQYTPFGDPLHTEVLKEVNSFHILSAKDKNYDRTEGTSPLSVYRKSKVWEASIDENMPVMHHWIYLELPHAMQHGKDYVLRLTDELNSDKQSHTFLYDEEKLVSPAIKISNTGYEADAVFKSADVYLWMGDGGEHDFSAHTGKAFHLINTLTGEKSFTGKLAFRMENIPEPAFGADFTMADVWECDFSTFRGEGTYKLVIEGIGSSHEFAMGNQMFGEPFKVAMQGMFYQRMGCGTEPAGNHPRARTPLHKQGVDPKDFTVYISKKDMVRGKNPDDRNFYKEELSGEIAKATWGGWCDAYDNDQRPVNFVCVYDLLLSYYLQPDVFKDNQLYIPETNNNVPDIIDEALWELDWWLRMRDSKGGYLTGLTNIRPPENINYAGAPCAWQGWCVAGAAAMAADCFRLAGMKEMESKYKDAAIEAFEWASKQKDSMLDVKVDELRGRDLRMTAAAFLYNLTGEERYEKIIAEESEIMKGNLTIRSFGEFAQQYASVAYIFCPGKISYPELQKNMRLVFIKQAKEDYVDKMTESPTKAARWTSRWEGMFQTSNEMSLVAIAHKISDNSEEKAYLEKGMYAEAEWTLGRNPLGLIQMTGLGEKCITQTFAPGRRDGYPGVTPGWTPYMCRDGWGNDDHIVRCEWYTNRNYPENKEIWPYGEHFWNSRYCVPNSETTPQQTFRQKIVLYSYLYGLSQN
ncbi:MAG: glycoside hydrolase family 9 protein [Bacteroidales bacterium]|nr:glycoside hydrolase family 9 protein [Bacteroidales bacterium]